jgi:hypothetical protein
MGGNILPGMAEAFCRQAALFDRYAVQSESEMSEKIEQRLTRVEKELELLKARTESDGLKSGWVSQVTGSFKDDPEFDEILRLGKEIRDSDQPGDSE